MLGLPWDQIHDEANRLEHAMSPLLIDRPGRLAWVIPRLTPMATPSHARTARLRSQASRRLNETPARKHSRRAPRARSVARRTALPKRDRNGPPAHSVEVLAREPLDGPLTLRIAENHQVLGRDLARVILVAPRAADQAV